MTPGPPSPIVAQMSGLPLLDLTTLSQNDVQKLFSEAERLSHEGPRDRQNSELRRGLTAALVFFEPSTRTKLSFETACARAGLAPIGLHGAGGTSLEKGESLEDTVFNVAAMSPAVMILRAPDEFDMRAVSAKLTMPVLNAGWGRRGHPTQALLDLFCLWREGRDLQAERLLICGDIRHSRVAASHLQLANILGVQVGVCGPGELLPETPPPGVHQFVSLSEGLEWATSIMALRVQLERHQGSFDLETFRKNWTLSAERLAGAPEFLRVLHPGPVNWGVELQEDVMRLKGCRILSQVEGGVWIRQGLIERALGVWS